jgi:streptomycin 6-kinase
MSKFQSNIISIYGEKGKICLDRLPELVEQISIRLGLKDLEPVSNLSYNYILFGLQGDSPIIIKLGLDSEALEREAAALKCFAEYGAVKVLAVCEGMLLLERAVPGTSLKSYFSDRSEGAVRIVCNAIKKLHQAKIPECHNFPHIKDWLSALDRNQDIPDVYLQKAKKLRDQLLQTTGADVLLHGDLHHDNVLQNNRAWVVIDPKGVIGDAAYEVAAFVRNPIPDLLEQTNTTEIINNNISMFSDILNISKARIVDWCFVQAVLSWVWSLEDGCETSNFEQITKVFYTINILNK